MRLLINRARRERRGKVLPFKKPAPKRAPYRPHERNGTCFAAEIQQVEYDRAGNEIIVGTCFSALHVSGNGNNVGGCDGFATIAAAEQAAWRLARRWQAIFVPSDDKGARS